MSLQDKKCVPCEGGTLPLNAEQIEPLKAELSLPWEILDNKKIRHVFTFKNFAEAMSFVNRVAEIAESEDHHPDITISWNVVTLELTTHAIDGLSENDFIVAKKIELL